MYLTFPLLMDIRIISSFSLLSALLQWPSLCLYSCTCVRKLPKNELVGLKLIWL